MDKEEMSKKSKRWRIDDKVKHWPITISCGDEHDIHTPIWVWGDEALAKRLVKWLEENQEKEPE